MKTSNYVTGKQTLVCIIAINLSIALVLLASSFANAKQDSVLTIGLVGQMVPSYSTDLDDMDDEWPAKMTVYEGLIRYKPGSFEIEPCLATRWNISEDGKVITFYLRKGIQFHKGFGEFTAEDVKASYERILDTKKWEYMAEDKQYWKDFDHVEIVDKYTVKLILKQPDYTWFTFLLPHYTGLITAKKALEKYGVEGSKTHAIGTGPYELVEWIPIDKIELKRYDKYWGEKPSIEKIKFISFGDEIAAAKALRAGQIDIMKPALESLESLRKDPNIKLKQYSGGGFSWIGMNIRKAPLDNLKVRQAIGHAVDVDEILKFIRREIADDPTTLRALSTIPAYFPEACPKEKCPPYEFSLETSKKLLKEAGYPDGFTIKMGAPSQGDMDDVAAILQRQLKKVGIKVEVTTLDQNAFWDSTTKWENEGAFPLFADEWYGYVVAPIMGVMDFQCNEPWNLMKWCNEEFTQIVGGIKQTRTREGRIEKYHRLQKLMRDAYIGIFIDYGNVVWAYRSNIDMGRSLPNGYHLPQTMSIMD